MTARTLLTNKKVEFVGTTDNPVDDLASHIALQKEDVGMTVSSSFRPDKGLYIEREEFSAWLKQLEEVTNRSIESYDSFLETLAERVDFFDAQGCRSSDHGIERMLYAEATKEEVATIFRSV